MENKPQIPTLKTAQKDDKKKTPLALRIRGLGSGGQSLLERFKQFKKKDLAFILAGLGVLFMAPLAEHFMMAPDNGSGTLGEGFSSRGDGAFGFGKGGSPYEGGVNGLAPGGLAGGGSDVITPLNVRDPAALVMGPSATQQPPAAAPAAPPPAAPDNKWNDALNAGKAAASAAVKKGGLPVPKVPLSAGGLRGLGAVSGGSGASFQLPAINAANVPNRPTPSAALSGTTGSGIKGAARGQGTGANAGALDQLKAKAGQPFERNAAVNTALENAANRDTGMGTGSGGAGPGGGASDKAAAQSQDKNTKSPGESLEFLRQKAEQEKAIDLKWKLKEKEAMLWPNLREKLLEEGIMTPFKALTKGIADTIGDLGKDASDKVICCQPGKTETCHSMNKPPSCYKTIDSTKSSDSTGFCLLQDGTLRKADGSVIEPREVCGPGGSGSGSGNQNSVGGADRTPGGDPARPAAGGKSLSDVCSQTYNLAHGVGTAASGGGVAGSAADPAARTAAYLAVFKAAGELAVVKKAFTDNGTDLATCNGAGDFEDITPAASPGITARLAKTRAALVWELAVMADAFDKENTNAPKILAQEQKATPIATALIGVTGDTNAATVWAAQKSPLNALISEVPSPDWNTPLVAAGTAVTKKVQGLGEGPVAAVVAELGRIQGFLDQANQHLTQANTFLQEAERQATTFTDLQPFTTSLRGSSGAVGDSDVISWASVNSQRIGEKHQQGTAAIAAGEARTNLISADAAVQNLGMAQPAPPAQTSAAGAPAAATPAADNHFGPATSPNTFQGVLQAQSNSVTPTPTLRGLKQAGAAIQVKVEAVTRANQDAMAQLTPIGVAGSGPIDRAKTQLGSGTSTVTALSPTPEVLKGSVIEP